jgi:hypothetical protein
MSTLTKTQVSQIRADLTAALAAVSAKHGVDFGIGTIRFSADRMTGKLVGITRSADAPANKPVAPMMSDLLNVGAKILGSKFNKDKIYTSPTLGMVMFCGYKASSYKFPFVIKTPGEKMYKLSVSQAIALLG